MLTRHKKLLLSVLGLAMFSGCASSPNNTESGALIGGGTGAAIGALADRHRPLEGALIGGGVGTAVGALAGNAADQKEKQQAAARTARALSPEEIVKMSKEGVSDNLIINQIRTSGTRYNLNADWIVWLQQNGVSQAVITEMQNTAAYRRPRYYYDEPVVVVGPPPPPAVGVAVVGGWRR
ncbi:MAG TPA: YMGG-like glycine zipper-containing protein [Gemmataceae bacterium]|nr:YMGG-like glycine zipper-containing protein [Gemmataceae bacterium]